MNRRLSTMVAGVIGIVGGAFMPTVDYTQRQVKVGNHAKGGKPFTRGKKSASLRSRGNRQKAKAKR